MKMLPILQAQNARCMMVWEVRTYSRVYLCMVSYHFLAA